jgi:hypothetical protein
MSFSFTVRALLMSLLSMTVYSLVSHSGKFKRISLDRSEFCPLGPVGGFTEGFEVAFGQLVWCASKCMPIHKEMLISDHKVFVFDPNDKKCICGVKCFGSTFGSGMFEVFTNAEDTRIGKWHLKNINSLSF